MNRRLLPLLAVALLPALAGAQESADSTTPRPRRSWTSDRREYTVGDILTVLVDEYTLASANKGQTGSDETSRTMGLDIRPPAGPGGVSTGIAATVGSNKNASSRQSGQASRDMRFRGEMTVRVVKVSPTGVLEVKGAKTVDVDKNRQDLTLSGFVRPEDVSRNNIVESSRIADAQVLYSLKGDLGKTRGGIVGRIISVFWP
jgi:flagellar L-ring protein precursor FlgH